MAQFKIKCSRCKINYVVTTARNSYGATCFDCNKKDMAGEITDPEMKKMFDIPAKFYEENSFLRSIKINYLKYGKLSEKQLEFFKKVVDDLTNPKKTKKVIAEEEKQAKITELENIEKTKKIKPAKKAKTKK